MHVKAWNEYKIDGTGKLIIGSEYSAYTVTDAIDMAEREAKAWNKRHKKDITNQVKFLTCNGFIRNVL